MLLFILERRGSTLKNIDRIEVQECLSNALNTTVFTESIIDALKEYGYSKTDSNISTWLNSEYKTPRYYYRINNSENPSHYLNLRDSGIIELNDIIETDSYQTKFTEKEFNLLMNTHNLSENMFEKITH